MATRSGVSVISLPVTRALRAMGPQTEIEVERELDVVAQMGARIMRKHIAKFQTVAANSVHVERPEPLVRDIEPGAAHAFYIEKGVKPGGKGLPRFFDPASAPILAWLQSKAFPGIRRSRVGSAAMQAVESELRDRYEGLAWHIRHKGVKAQPFRDKTRAELEPIFRTRMTAAVERAAQAAAARASQLGAV